eukprot:Nk52_evm56s270 gene=Nk52_evmTU56s270
MNPNNNNASGGKPPADGAFNFEQGSNLNWQRGLLSPKNGSGSFSPQNPQLIESPRLLTSNSNRASSTGPNSNVVQEKLSPRMAPDQAIDSPSMTSSPRISPSTKPVQHSPLPAGFNPNMNSIPGFGGINNPNFLQQLNTGMRFPRQANPFGANLQNIGLSNTFNLGTLGYPSPIPGGSRQPQFNQFPNMTNFAPIPSMPGMENVALTAQVPFPSNTSTSPIASPMNTNNSLPVRDRAPSAGPALVQDNGLNGSANGASEDHASGPTAKTVVNEDVAAKKRAAVMVIEKKLKVRLHTYVIEHQKWMMEIKTPGADIENLKTKILDNRKKQDNIKSQLQQIRLKKESWIKEGLLPATNSDGAASQALGLPLEGGYAQNLNHSRNNEEGEPTKREDEASTTKKAGVKTGMKKAMKSGVVKKKKEKVGPTAIASLVRNLEETSKSMLMKKKKPAEGAGPISNDRKVTGKNPMKKSLPVNPIDPIKTKLKVQPNSLSMLGKNKLAAQSSGIKKFALAGSKEAKYMTKMGIEFTELDEKAWKSREKRLARKRESRLKKKRENALHERDMADAKRETQKLGRQGTKRHIQEAIYHNDIKRRFKEALYHDRQRVTNAEIAPFNSLKDAVTSLCSYHVYDDEQSELYGPAHSAKFSEAVSSIFQWKNKLELKFKELLVKEASKGSTLDAVHAEALQVMDIAQEVVDLKESRNAVLAEEERSFKEAETEKLLEIIKEKEANKAKPLAHC